jgi:mono/diheme cytochrome c family protein
MRTWLWFLAGAVSAIAVAGIAAATLLPRAQGFSATRPPGVAERWLMQRLRSAAIPRAEKEETNPIPDSAEVQAEARAHWADHCAVCHANNGSGDVEMGRHMYPPAPDMRLAATQSLTDGELFFIIQNGVRETGMPAWGADSTPPHNGGHAAEASWKLVRFIRHLPKLTFDEEREMRELNPKSPEDLKEEQEERDFLKGGDQNEQTHHHHH